MAIKEVLTPRQNEATLSWVLMEWNSWMKLRGCLDRQAFYRVARVSNGQNSRSPTNTPAEVMNDSFHGKQEEDEEEDEEEQEQEGSVDIWI